MCEFAHLAFSSLSPELLLSLAGLALLDSTSIGALVIPIWLMLAAYCVVMVLPAVILLTGRLAARSLIEPLLLRLNKWITEQVGNATGWVLGIAGFLVARDAIAGLFTSVERMF
jgi:hypothetical protein